MNLIGSLVDEIRPYQDLRDMMEPMISYHVLPELQSPEPYLRFRSLWFYGEFDSYSYQDHRHVHQAMDSIFQCLHPSQPSLPVRFYAATTIYKLLKHNEVAQSFLRPALKDILEIYLNMMNEIDSDELVTALERIVAFYKEDMEPFALMLSRQLTDSYPKLVQVDARDDGGESAIAALGCVTAITRIIRSCKGNQMLLAKIEEIIYSVL